jgi:hypothetical protein
MVKKSPASFQNGHIDMQNGFGGGNCFLVLVALAAVHRSSSPGFYLQLSMPVHQAGSGFPRL